MPIKVVCQCGASFAAKDELAGKAVRCPKCKQPLRIPAAAPAPAPVSNSVMDDLFDEVGIEKKLGPTCPSCGAELKPNAVMCITCGVNFESGEQSQGHVLADSAEGHEAATQAILARAERQIQIDKEDDRKNKSSGPHAIVYLFYFFLLIAFVAMNFLLGGEAAFWITAICISVFVQLLTVYWSILIIIVAFQEKVWLGFAYMFVPFFAWYFWWSRWDKVGDVATRLILVNLCLNAWSGAMIGIAEFLLS